MNPLRVIGPIGLIGLIGCRSESARTAAVPPPPPAEGTAWPWPRALKEELRAGVIHWQNRAPADGTILDLLQFDFGVNPRLRLELYDQDEDDDRPFDNAVNHRPHGVGWAIRHLEEIGRGPVIAAWNGLFFATDHRAGGVARHVAPVVLNGKPHFNVGSHRWMFGVHYIHNTPEFKALHRDVKTDRAKLFTFAAEGAQLLVKSRRPLALRPYPHLEEVIPKGAQPSTAGEAGFIPMVDHMRTSRTSLGWSLDNRRLWLLIVDEPDTESQSALELRRNLPPKGGWTVADLQRFWLSRSVWGAVNLDGGGLTQMAYLRPDGRYSLIAGQLSRPNERLILPKDFKAAPPGGSIMYFYLREVPAQDEDRR